MTKNAAMWQVLRLLRLRHGSGRCLGFLDLDLEAEAGRKDRDRAVEALFILLFIIIAAIILCVFHGVHRRRRFVSCGGWHFLVRALRALLGPFS